MSAPAFKNQPLEELDQVFEEWIKLWLNTRRLVGMAEWQRNILDRSSRGEIPDAYFSVKMSAFNTAMNGLKPSHFGAVYLSCLKNIGGTPPPVKKIAFYCNTSREQIYQQTEQARLKVMISYHNLVKFYEDTSDAMRKVSEKTYKLTLTK